MSQNNTTPHTDASGVPQQYQWVNATNPTQFKDRERMKEVRRGVMLDYLQRAESDPNCSDKRVKSRQTQRLKRKRIEDSHAESSTAAQRRFKTEPSLVERPTPGFMLGPESSASPQTIFSPDLEPLQQSIVTGPLIPFSTGYSQFHLPLTTTNSSSSLATNAEEAIARRNRGLSEPITADEQYLFINYGPRHLSATTTDTMSSMEHINNELYDYGISFPARQHPSVGSTTSFPTQPMPFLNHMPIGVPNTRPNTIPDHPGTLTSEERLLMRETLFEFTKSNAQLEHFTSNDNFRACLFLFEDHLMQGELNTIPNYQKLLTKMVEGRGGLKELDDNGQIAARITMINVMLSTLYSTPIDPVYLNHTRLGSSYTSASHICESPLYTPPNQLRLLSHSDCAKETLELLNLSRELIDVCLSPQATSSTDSQSASRRPGALPQIHPILASILTYDLATQLPPAYNNSNNHIYECVRLAALLSADAAVKGIPLSVAVADRAPSSPGRSNTPKSKGKGKGKGKGKAKVSTSGREGLGITVSHLVDALRKTDVENLWSSTSQSRTGAGMTGVLFWVILVALASATTSESPSAGMAHLDPGRNDSVAMESLLWEETGGIEGVQNNIKATSQGDKEGETIGFLVSLAVRTAGVLRRADTGGVLRMLDRFLGFMDYLAKSN